MGDMQFWSPGTLTFTAGSIAPTEAILALSTGSDGSAYYDTSGARDDDAFDIKLADNTGLLMSAGA